MSTRLFPGLLPGLLALWWIGCAAEPGAPPSAFFQELALETLLDEEGVRFDRGGGLTVSRDESSGILDDRAWHHRSLAGDLRLPLGQDEAFFGAVEAVVEQRLRDADLEIHAEGGSTLLQRRFWGYRAPGLSGWVEMWGVRQGDDDYRWIVLIHETGPEASQAATR